MPDTTPIRQQPSVQRGRPQGFLRETGRAYKGHVVTWLGNVTVRGEKWPRNYVRAYLSLVVGERTYRASYWGHYNQGGLLRMAQVFAEDVAAGRVQPARR